MFYEPTTEKQEDKITTLNNNKMETIIKWININDNLPKTSDKILIYTKYCKNKIDVGYYNGKDFFCGNCKTYNVEYWANIPDILDNN